MIRIHLPNLCSTDPTSFADLYTVSKSIFSSGSPFEPEAHQALGNSVFDSVSGSPSSEGSALGSSYCGTSAFVNPFRVFLALFGQKSPKRTGMTSLGFPGLSSQSIRANLLSYGSAVGSRPSGSIL